MCTEEPKYPVVQRKLWEARAASEFANNTNRKQDTITVSIEVTSLWPFSEALEIVAKHKKIPYNFRECPPDLIILQCKIISIYLYRA